ncbi:uncharacterized protein F4817DRAFT_316227 [Daldinia loculata]|uniref:uncharacterized protein n=1 Tax=Daldinia loculata TaxID=103429 RepID=UPI0020C2A78F|nr:uncharacterized protein F4817DRAFT_316227 [Daldinia loculata]KAI1647135.1 hypothetical protein F4817DRAFT_316227 [Daldinia loculata]
MIQDPETKQKLIESAKMLLARARESNVAIVHCLIDTTIEPPVTNKVAEQWASVHKPMLIANPELAAEFNELTIVSPPADRVV